MGKIGEIMTIEGKLYQYLKEKKISIRKLSKGTGIKYNRLYDCMARKDRKREMKAWELLEVCKYLKIDPRKL